ncbi:MAG: diguanylate cyclase [Lachnospiraceae bacterium]|nr:diguanylate cyclase [Lachnospiraceae bacterium]
MDHINLHVYIVSENEKLENTLKGIGEVKDVSLSFTTVKDASGIESLQNKFDEIIIARDMNALKPYIGAEGVGLIYIGTPEGFEKECGQIPDNLIDIWSEDISEEYMLSRFKKAVKDAIIAYRAWLYENYLMSTIDSMLDLVWYKDKAGLHWLVNNKFEDTVHKSREQIHGRGHNYIWDVPPEDGGKAEFRCLESEREVFEKKETCIADEQVKTANGVLRHFLTYKSPLYDRSGNVMGTVGIGHDVTDMNNRSLELKILLENLPMATVVCDAEFKPLQANPMFEEAFGVQRDNLSLLEYRKWKEDVFLPLSEERYSSQYHSSHQELEYNVNGEKRYYSLTEQEILDYYENVTGYYCFFRNVTEAKEYEEMILTRANTDEMTKLYNRRYFFEAIMEHKDDEITLLFMDMDNFKKVNDTFGHNMGDDVLIDTANKIKQFFPKGIAARLGGDEFAVALFGEQDEAELRGKSDEFIKSVEEKYASLKVGLSVSVGEVSTKGNLEDIDAFINESDQRMYEKKVEKKKSLGQDIR